MELEIEREEQQKALALLKELRKKEKEELEGKINQEKEHSNKSTEEVRR